MRTVTWANPSTDVVMWVAVTSVGRQLKSGMVGEGNMNASLARCVMAWGLAWVRFRLLFLCQWERID